MASKMQKCLNLSLVATDQKYVFELLTEQTDHFVGFERTNKQVGSIIPPVFNTELPGGSILRDMCLFDCSMGQTTVWFNGKEGSGGFRLYLCVYSYATQTYGKTVYGRVNPIAPNRIEVVWEDYKAITKPGKYRCYLGPYETPPSYFK